MTVKFQLKIDGQYEFGGSAPDLEVAVSEISHYLLSYQDDILDQPFEFKVWRKAPKKEVKK